MAINIESTALQSFDQLPAKSQTILLLIPQAKKWVKRAIADGAKSFDFISEEDFITQIAVNIHSSQLVFFRKIGIFIGVQKLFDMTQNDLRDLYDLNRFGGRSGVDDRNSFDEEEDDEGVDHSEAAIFEKYQLTCNASLQKQYSEFNVEDTSIGDFLIGADFDQKLVLYRAFSQVNQFYGSSKGDAEKLDVDGLEWAESRAQSLAEFSRYYILYLLFSPLVSASHLSPSSTDRSLNTRATLDTFVQVAVPMISECMSCPVLSQRLDQYGLSREIADWAKRGNTLGFFDVSSGLLCIAGNMDAIGGDAENSKLNLTELKQEIRTKIAAYIDALNTSLLKHLAVDAQMTQSGKDYRYFYSLSDSQLVLNLDGQGCLSVYSQTPLVV